MYASQIGECRPVIIIDALFKPYQLVPWLR